MQHLYDNEVVNTREYWDERFITDWNENKGDEQSRWFARIALENMPDWFTHWLRERQPSFCDWGCALGDGTEMIRQTLGLVRISGIDFSGTAIDMAKSKFSDIPFHALDLESAEEFPRFDVIFSSNTLEHFRDPWKILNKLCGLAKLHVVILIPFEEYSRHHEHFYTFDASNIPILAGESHLLSYTAILDGTAYTPTYWLGKQILLIYSVPSAVAHLTLHLSDKARTNVRQIEFYQQLILQQEALLSKLSADKEDRLHSVSTLVSSLQERLAGTEQHMEALALEIKGLRAESQSMHALIAENESLRNLLDGKENLLFTLQSAHNAILSERAILEEKLRNLREDLEKLGNTWPWRMSSSLKKLLQDPDGGSEK